MKAPSIIALVLVIAAVVIAGWYIDQAYLGSPSSGYQYPTSSVSGGTSTTPPAFDQSISDGTFIIAFPSSEFGLATNQQQLLVHSYIPPCDQGFNYCFYYIGSAYHGTNFESAGIRVKKRADLTTENKCLTTQPTGYMNLIPLVATSSQYGASVFSTLGNGAAGHYANDTLYRLWAPTSAAGTVATTNAGKCYDFETRIGQSQFSNYPSGTIKEFTGTDQTTLQNKMQKILNTLTIASGTPVAFPQ